LRSEFRGHMRESSMIPWYRNSPTPRERLNAEDARPRDRASWAVAGWEMSSEKWSGRVRTRRLSAP
jgi:hypothetical protein